ncbi:MAG: hypothetical protein WBH01_10560 [Dehalococcoidia bacterium]
MRVAAGIILIIVGIALLVGFVPRFIEDGIGTYDLPFVNPVMVVSALFFVTGGVFCLRRKYWRVCFASALLLVGLWVLLFFILAVVWALLPPGTPVWWIGVPIPVGILPIIFVCLRRREWSESKP